MFDYLSKPRDITKYTLMRGVTDFGNMAQFNMFEGGHPLLILVSTPKFLEKLAQNDSNFNVLFTNYKHILEYEFRGISGLDAITGDTQEITNGIASVNMITKVNMQSASTFSMNYQEKSGSVITKVHEAYLKGVYDPRSNFKHYHGLIEKGIIPAEEAGYEQEIFSFLYILTDNTGRRLERAVFIVAAQPTSADFTIYNTEKGDNSFKDISVEFNGFPIINDDVDRRAQEVLDWIINPANANRMHLNSNDFTYTGQDAISDLVGK